MNGLDAGAISGLSAAIQSVLPPPPDPNTAPLLAINPLRLTATGIGAFAGVHPDPRAEVFGRRLRATAAITVRGDDTEELNTAAGTVTGALIGAGRGTLTGLGILRLELARVGADVDLGPGPGPNAQRELVFDVLYEHLPIPETAGGVIKTIPLALDLSPTGRPAKALLSEGFTLDPLADFEVFDDPAADTAAPSQWEHNAAEARIDQLSAIRGGPGAAGPDKPGTYLLRRASAAVPPVSDLILRAALGSGAGGGIGAVFRWQDPDHYYFFLMDNQASYRLLGRKRAGSFEALDEGGLDAAAGYPAGQVLELKLVVFGSTLQAYLDEALVLSGSDGAIAGAGRVGLLSRNNDQARFYRLGLVSI